LFLRIYFHIKAVKDIYAKDMYTMEGDEELQELRKKRMRELMKRSVEAKMPENVPVGIIPLDSGNFNEIINSNVPVLVDFYTVWCPPCETMKPIVETLAKDYAGKFVFAKLNCDEESSIARQFSVYSIPTFIFFREGKPVKQVVGAVGRDPIEKIIKSLIS
jgi:thioredoxin 1